MNKTEFEVYTKILNEVNKLSFEKLSIQIPSSKEYFMITMILENKFTVYISVYFEDEEDEEEITICTVYNDKNERIYSNSFTVDKIEFLNTLNK